MMEYPKFSKKKFRHNSIFFGLMADVVRKKQRRRMLSYIRRRLCLYDPLITILVIIELVVIVPHIAIACAARAPTVTIVFLI